MAIFNIKIERLPDVDIAGENMLSGSLIYLADDSKWYKSNATSKITSTTELKLLTTDALSDEVIEPISYGEYPYPIGSLVSGKKYYVSVIPGGVTSDVYNNSTNIIRYVGTAIDTETLLFNPDQTYISDYNTTVNDIIISPNTQLGDHTHLEEDITDLDKYTQEEIDIKLEYVAYTNKPNNFSVKQELKAGMNMNNTSIEGVTEIDFDITNMPSAWKEGRIFYDTRYKTWTAYNDIDETSLQIGEEQRVRVYNGNGDSLLDGEAVTVVGTTSILGGYTEENILIVVRANSHDKQSALNTIGIATHTIEVGTYGYAASSGYVRNVDTSAYPVGSAIWLSPTVLGQYVLDRPASPNYEVRMGGIVKSHPTEGIIYAELRIIDNDHDNNKFFNGAILSAHNVLVETDGTKVEVALYSAVPGEELSLIFNQEYSHIADNSRIELVLGTNGVPVTNFVYIPESTGVLTTSAIGFPTAEQYVPIGDYEVPSAVRSNTTGIYKSHAWTDHLSGNSGQGHLSHINKWIRRQNATYYSGIILTPSVALGVSAPLIDLLYSSGVVDQLHEHTTPIFDTSLTSVLFIINDPDVPYQVISNLNPTDLDKTSDGINIINKYFAIVVWMVVSQEDKDCQLMINLPNKSYTNEADVLSDIDKSIEYSIPNRYKGTGVLLDLITLKRTNSTLTIVDIKSLRGLLPSLSGGGTTGGVNLTRWTELLDTPSVIESLRSVRGNAAGTSLEFWDAQPALPIGLEGQVYYIDTDTTNNIEPSFILKEGIIVETQAEFDSIVVEGISLANVFTTWYMFAHSNGGTEFSPPTFPGLDPTGAVGTALTQDIYESGNTWGYDPVGDRIYLSQNFGPYTGFISPKKFSNYTLEATLSSTNNDDDNIGLIIGFHVDPITGYEHTLSVVMSLNVPQGATVSYGVYYNFSQSVAGGSESYLVANGTTTLPFPVPYRGWVGSQTRIRVIRTGNTFSIKGSQFGSTLIDDTTELLVDLTSDVRLSKFMISSQVGFSAKSQARAYFSDIFFTGFQDYIFFPDGSGTYTTWEWNPTTEIYFLQDPKTVFVENHFGRGRFVYSPIFGKTYYVTQDDEIIKIGNGATSNSSGSGRTSALINDGEILGGGDRFLLASELEGLIPPTTIDKGTVLIDGDVIWQSGLTFYVYATKYKIEGILREGFINATVTLGAADTVDSRIDSFIIRNNGIEHSIENDSIIVIPGTPSSDPAKAVLDNELELEISFATIDANATEPTSAYGLSVEDVYLENVEWTVTGATGTIDAASTSLPITGLVSILHTNPEHKKSIYFTSDTDMFVSSQAVLQFDIKLDTVWDYKTRRSLVIEVYIWINNSRFTGRLRIGDDAGFNFDAYNITTTQTVYLRLDRFPNIYGSNTYNKIEFKYMYLNEETFRIDNVKIVEGYGGSSQEAITVPSKTSDLLNDGEFGTSKFIEEAPINGNQYARQDAGWSEVGSSSNGNIDGGNSISIYTSEQVITGSGA